MAVLSCAGNCPRLISESNQPGGNPVAVADPKNWAVDYVECVTCGIAWCDSCHAELGLDRCPDDGGVLEPRGVSVNRRGRPWWKFWA
jgi:hypothetical protein